MREAVSGAVLVAEITENGACPPQAGGRLSTEDTTVAPLRQIASLAPGSTLAMTFLLPVELLDPADRPGLRASEEGARASGTPFLSFYAPQEMPTLAREAGFKDACHVSGASHARALLRRPPRTACTRPPARTSCWPPPDPATQPPYIRRRPAHATLATARQPHHQAAPAWPGGLQPEPTAHNENAPPRTTGTCRTGHRHRWNRRT
ncbi:hypothetical protein [Streptomyces sp. BPTC-684]|uniref:hypothetical protein n=1 Tax=Streptomyces sp. BPTC-684 TaxID=3043734 RepID=UPI0024B096CD|nr:hypothetical protein [Streptomyces sp. BPTC-684]WHM40939.1 hypothetical protein QIY60_31400 [Streptomyces sp. BPTC-684]